MTFHRESAKRVAVRGEFYPIHFVPVSSPIPLGWWCRGVSLRNIVVLCVLVLLSQASAQDLSNQRTSVLQQQAQRAVETQQFAEAVPALTELNRRFRESEDPAIQKGRESILYFLGLGQLQATDLSGTVKTMQEFITAFPEGRNLVFARLYLGDALYYQNKLEEARGVYDELRAKHDLAALEPAQQLGFWDKLSDCYFSKQDWDGGKPVFQALSLAAGRQFDASLASQKRAKASSYLLQAAIAQDALADALAVLPELSDRGGEARYDLSLNLALMRGGDQLYESNRYGEALFFYQQVLRPGRMDGFWFDRVNQLQGELDRVGNIAVFAGQKNELENQLAVANARLEQIRTNIGGAIPDYTGALNFRIARCYLVRERNYEAYWAFSRLWEGERDSEAKGSLAEDALYGVIKTAAAINRADRAKAAANDYLARPGFTRFVADVGYELIQLEAQVDNTAGVAALCAQFLDRVRAQPALAEAPKLVYLAGSNLLALDDLPALRAQFEPLVAQFPESGFTDGALYWLGLASIFEGDFKGAMQRFGRIIEVFPRGPYAEDARYRIGVCQFGLLDYPAARASLEEFIGNYPQSRLLSEAYALAGDLAAAEGRIDDAIAAYTASGDEGAKLTPPNYAYINHAVFQAGKLLAANSRWTQMATWFDTYINRWGREAGRLGDAIYELGRAQEALGRTDEMLDSYLKAIVRFGNDPADNGPDLMLADYPTKYQAAHGELPVTLLNDALNRAQAQGETTLVLRLAYALRAMDAATDETPRAFADQLDAASPAVLVQIARSEQSFNPDLALQAAEQAIARQPNSPFAEEAWHLIAVLRATGEDTDGALAAYRQIAQLFPASKRTAEARLREGDLLRQSGDRAGALEVYKAVLQTRQWRGAAWAEANFKIGLTHYEAGEFEEAFGFCQRVYVLYGGVPEWASQAYLYSGLALEKLGRREDAVKTYKELLGIETLKATAAAREATRRLGELS